MKKFTSIVQVKRVSHNKPRQNDAVSPRFCLKRTSFGIQADQPVDDVIQGLGE